MLILAVGNPDTNLTFEIIVRVGEAFYLDDRDAKRCVELALFLASSPERKQELPTTRKLLYPMVPLVRYLYVVVAVNRNAAW